MNEWKLLERLFDVIKRYEKLEQIDGVSQSLQYYAFISSGQI